MLPPAIVIHGHAHLLAATAPGRPVLLLSAPGAAAFAGAGWWHALTAGHTAALDCGDQPGRALEAFSVGCPIVILQHGPAWTSVAARRGTALLLRHRPPALDLARPGAERHLAAWLEGGTPPAPRQPRTGVTAPAASAKPPPSDSATPQGDPQCK